MKSEIELCHDLGIPAFSLSRETMELLLQAYNLGIKQQPTAEEFFECVAYITGYNDAIEDAVDTIDLSDLQRDVSSLKKKEKKIK